MTAEKRVFVIQVPARRDNNHKGEWIEKFDLKPAEEHGRLVRVLGYGNVPADPAPTRAALETALSGFDPDLDSVLLLGDPVACAQAIHVLAYIFNISRFSVLKWDRREERYFPYQIG